jgi:hypothetical protein
LIVFFFAPCALLSPAADAAQVTLVWNRNPESDVAGYKMHYGATRGNYQYIVDVGNQTSCTISGLEEGKTYYFAASAYSLNNDESALSQELAYTIPNESAPSTASTGDSGTANNNDDLTSYYGTDSDNQLYISDSSVFLAINAGGPKYVAADGTVYMADAHFSGGRTAKTRANIGDTEDDTVYRSERYGNFSYDIPVPNGNYIVTLKFAEIYWSAANRRIFDVEIQGKEIISNLDIYAAVGKNFAYDVNVPVSVTDGVLKIDFFTDKDNAKVSAINVKKVVSDNSYNLLEAGSNVVFATNAGGPKYVAADGTVYMADTHFSRSRTAKTSARIGDTEDDAVYQSERYGNFSYDIPVPNGNYIVTLKFAEIYWSAANRRIFDVEIQGKEIISNLDIYAAVGKNFAYDVNVPVSVTDGVLKIDFFTDKDNAKVSAIRVSK